MDAKQRRQRGLLVALFAVLGVVLAFQFWPGGPAAGGGSPAGTSRPAPGARRTAPSTAVAQVVDVGLGRLEEPPPAVSESGRNPFRFQARAPVAVPSDSGPVGRPPPGPSGTGPEGNPDLPSGPPPPPPISLKFIGLVTGEGEVGKVAVLSDGKFVYYGREGDIIEGRYRVVKIGEESIQMEYVDGRGRQTIRLSGA
jgi:hypothetical protein